MASSARIDELRKKFEENPRRYFAPLANEYRKAGDVEQAIAICREYLPQQPGHMSGHIVYGQALYEGREFEEAKTVFETALSLDPENLIALRHLGDIALILGDTEGARSWYGRVLEADPRNEEIQSQLKSLEGVGPTTSAAVSAGTETPIATRAVADPTSTAETVVIPAMKLQDAETTAEQSVPAPRVEQPPTPRVETLGSAPTAEITLDRVTTPGIPALDNLETLPAAAPEPTITFEPEGQPPNTSSDLAGFEPTAAPAAAPDAIQPMDLDISTSAGSGPPIDSFTLEGLETTAMDVGSPAAATSSLDIEKSEEPELTAATPAPVGLDLPTDLASRPENLDLPPILTSSADSEPAEKAPDPTADLPMLDVPDESIGASKPEPPPAPPAPPAAPAASPEPGPFVTETMAELYLSQGHRDEALRVYRALVEQRPGDAALRAKLEKMQADSGPTIRELLARVASRRPGTPSAPAPPFEAASRVEPPPVDSPAPESPVFVEPAAPVESADTIAAFLGAAAPSDEAERAALVLSSAFSDVSASNGQSAGDAPAIAGTPARPASKDLSLDAVFGAAEGTAPAPASFSFDQFFAQPNAGGGGASGTGNSPGQEARDDVAKFTQWLEGLKQR